MNLMSRESVCQKLSISRWQSYQMFSGNALHLVREADVLMMANSLRVAISEPFKYVPEMLTSEDVSRLTGIPPKKIKVWSNRTRNPIPHVRFNAHTVRFVKSSVMDWLERNSK